ncbi:isoprenylcysteine carboxylmethyltransferase family protein [Kitasatospora sp. NPDC001539]|uniref:methyltransferase family protein n=1 Tax=Kitasatospora sp. NPDC001539 TaxID=3154384 RepID=UPI0033199810
MSRVEQKAGTGPSWAVRAPQLLFVVAVLATGTGLVTHLRHAGEPVDLVAAALVACYLGWLAVEIPVTFRTSGAAPRESATLLLYAAARIATVSAAVLGPLPWHTWSPLLLVPAAVFAGGVVLRQVAIHTLGRFYSHHVTRQTDHQVVTWGVYRFIRHPAYAGMLSAHVGFVGFFLNPLSLALLVALAAAITFRIRTEERMLVNIPGYRAYAAERPALVPGLW